MGERIIDQELLELCEFAKLLQTICERILYVDGDFGLKLTFTYTVAGRDEGFGDRPRFTDTATVTVLINRGPVAVDDAVTFHEGGSSVTIDPLANDSDPNGDPLTTARSRSSRSPARRPGASTTSGTG